VAGVDAVVSATGMKISRIRYEAESDRYNKTREVVSLCQLKAGERGEVVAIQRADRSVLQKLLAMAVVPGSALKVEFTSPVVVFQVENTRVAVDHGVADGIRVCRIRRSPLKSITYLT
jgi:Fe2+ transport system protein FeoA